MTPQQTIKTVMDINGENYVSIANRVGLTPAQARTICTSATVSTEAFCKFLGAVGYEVVARDPVSGLEFVVEGAIK